jgi:hypothetical protein
MYGLLVRENIFIDKVFKLSVNLKYSVIFLDFPLLILLSLTISGPWPYSFL